MCDSQYLALFAAGAFPRPQYQGKAVPHDAARPLAHGVADGLRPPRQGNLVFQAGSCAPAAGDGTVPHPGAYLPGQRVQPSAESAGREGRAETTERKLPAEIAERNVAR